MYQVDDKDKVVELDWFPQSDVGAPLPAITASEHDAGIAYRISEPDPNGDGTDVNVVGREPEASIAMAIFKSYTGFYFGYPNDEALSGHPLYDRGLAPYGAFEVLNSSWIREMERRNEVHPYHKGDWLSNRRHFVLAFHDSIFECIARDVSIEVMPGSVSTVMASLTQRLHST